MDSGARLAARPTRQRHARGALSATIPIYISYLRSTCALWPIAGRREDTLPDPALPVLAGLAFACAIGMIEPKLFMDAHMPFDNWDEIRTAYQVARVGTVSGAAEALGVHHATVIRHVDALEAKLGAKLFQRHPRGYTPTEAGRQLLAVGQSTEDQFSQLAARITGAGEEVSGELIVTALPGLSGLILPAMAYLLERHPSLRLRYLTDNRIFRLEYGEAHVAVRAGPRPTEPDNVVQSLGFHSYALYGSAAYVARHGRPETEEDLIHHRFVANDSRETRAPFLRWLAEKVPEECYVLRTNGPQTWQNAIIQGLGLGFLPTEAGQADQRLVEIFPTRKEWQSDLWLVTHVDLHRTSKVQALLNALKEAAKSCPEPI